MEILSVLYLIAYAFSGVMISKYVFMKDKPVRQLFFGLVFGLAMLLWLPTLFAFLLDFTLLAQLLALATAVLGGGLCVFLRIKKAGRGLDMPIVREKGWLKPLLLTVVPLVIIGWVLLYNHTILSASNGSLHVGQSTYGDLCMHLGFISSISVQQTFPPDYSILPGTALGYPFLCDSISSTFYTLGSSLRFAALLPTLYAYLVVVLGVYFFFEDWFKRNSITVLATYMFFIGGGLGFAYIFNNKQLLAAEGIDRFQEMLSGFYLTPTNLPDEGLRWVNAIADMLVPQRATLFGWAMLFPCLQLLRRAAIEKENRLFIPLGILAGCLPLVHTHSFLALGIISVLLIVVQFTGQLRKPNAEGWKHLGMFAIFGAITLVLAAPQLFGFTFKQSTGDSFLRFMFNWDNKSDSWLWFYIKNLGLIFIFMVPAFLSTKKENKLFYGGALLIWLISELIVFQPNPYDNNKLLFVWFAMTCGIVAEYLMSLYDRMVDRGKEAKQLVPLGKRLAQRFVCIVILIAIFLSGTLTLVREYVSGDHIGIATDEDGKKTIAYIESGYEVTPSYMVELTEYIKENTAPDATFLTYRNHNNAIAMLTGRNIFCGSTTFLHWHGLEEQYRTRINLLPMLYTNPSVYFYENANTYSIDYVLISPYESNNYDVDTAWFESNLELVYSNSRVKLYKVANAE